MGTLIAARETEPEFAGGRELAAIREGMCEVGPVYLDMDPGHDDALALLVALGSLPVAGVSVVAGNQTVDKTMRNARRVLDVAGFAQLALRQGAACPMFLPLHTAPEVHGASGLDGYRFHSAVKRQESPEGALPWLRRQFSAAAAPVVWIATGPLTNVAEFLLGHPDLKETIGEISVMGGALNGGNVTAHAEFNFYVDPDAADVVLRAGIPMRMVGLDVTTRALLPLSAIERFGMMGTDVGAMLKGLFEFYAKHEPQATAGGVPVHDVLAVGAVVHPELFTWLPASVRVERSDGSHRGQVIVGEGGADSTVRVATAIDSERFFEWMWDVLERHYSVGG